MRKAIADIAELALLDILFDGVQSLFLGNLEDGVSTNTCRNVTVVESFPKRVTYLHLGIRPSWNFHNHIEDSLLLVGVQGNVMEG